MSKRYRTQFKNTLQMICSCTFKKKPNALSHNQAYISYSPGVTYKFNKNLGSSTITNSNIINSKRYLTPSNKAHTSH